MTRDELIAALAPSRLPDSLLRPGWPEMLTLFGLGLLAGLLLALALRPLLRLRVSQTRRIRATRGQPAQERLLSIGRILGRLPQGLRAAAYGTAPPPSDAQIERIARRGR